MKWFGKTWSASINEECEQIGIPLGWPCTYCDELIECGDKGVQYDNGPVAHLECFLRATIGPVAHQLRTCSCYVKGASETDPPELSKREAARLAVELWKKASGYDA